VSVWESFRIAFEGVWTNKMRSALTMLGIVIGIASVIAVVAIGQGGRILLEKEVSRVLGVNVFRIYINWSEGEVRGLKLPITTWQDILHTKQRRCLRLFQRSGYIFRALSCRQGGEPRSY